MIERTTTVKIKGILDVDSNIIVYDGDVFDLRELFSGYDGEYIESEIKIKSK